MQFSALHPRSRTVYCRADEALPERPRGNNPLISADSSKGFTEWRSCLVCHLSSTASEAAPQTVENSDERLRFASHSVGLPRSAGLGSLTSEASVAAVYTKKGTRESHVPFFRTGGSYLFFAAFFFFAPLAFFAICNPPLRWFVDCEHSAPRPAHCAAWHVGPGVGDPRFAG